MFVCLLMAAAVAVTPLGFQRLLERPLEAVVWVAFIAAGNLLTIPVLPRLGIDASIGGPISVASAVVLPAPLVVLINALGFTNERELRGRADAWHVVFNRAQAGLSAGAAAVAANLQPGDMVTGTIVAVIVYNVVNTGAVAVGVVLLGRQDIGTATRNATVPFPRFAVDFGLVALLALMVVIAYQQVGAVAVVLLAVPLWLGYSALRSARVAEDRAEQLAARVADLETLNGFGARLLTVRRPDQIAEEGERALRAVLESEDVVVSLAGDVGDGLEVVKVQGAEPTAIGVPAGATGASLAVVEAIAGLLSMALQRLELERELSETERARTALSGKILEEGTRERSRIALEIHDEVLPYFAAGEIQADNVRSSLRAGDTEGTERLAAATRDAVGDGIERLREVLDALRRQVVVPGGLRPALLDALDELRLHHGLRASLHAPDPFPPLPLAVEILLLETIRGCLANVARHADACAVDVILDITDATVLLTVRDDGRGFDPASVPDGHHGLALMSQRVELGRGRFAVESAPDAGTTVEVEVPV